MSAQAPAYARERAVIDSMAGAEMRDGPLAGLAIAVVKGRDTIVMKGYGLADVEQDIPVTPATVFRIGSVTKQFTSSAIMTLVERGSLRLTDTLGALLPHMPARWQGVTLSQLLDHTSGIPSYTSAGPRWQRRWREDMLPDSIVGLVAGDTMNFAPGSRYRYNNSGYVLLGMILEKRAGRPYARHVQETLFQPLGLTQTTYCYPQSIIRHRAHGYDRAGREFRNAEYLSMTQPHAAGALCSTVRDLVAWTDALHSGRVVSATSFARMTAPQGAAARAHYGFGLVHDTLEGHPRIAHGGGIHGFASELARYPKDSLTVVVLSNTVPSPTGMLANNIARVIFGLPLEGVMPPRVRLPVEQLNLYAATYVLALPDGRTLPIRVFVEADHIMAQAQGQGAFELIPFGNHQFGATVDRTMRLTFAVEGGRVTKLQFQQGGAAMEGRRQ
jgi:CubicO group peptidase (beta-lactamase class C family)